MSVANTVRVLAFEFRGVSETADFGFLAGPVAAGQVRRVDPVNDHLKTQLSLAAQVDLQAGALSAPPELVIAYCACAALGAHVAASLETGLLLVDPDALTKEAVRRDFELLCRRLGTEPPAAESAAQRPQPQWEQVLAASRARLASVHGGDEEALEMVDDLFDRYRAWLRFIYACSTAAPAAPKKEVTVIARKPLTNLAALLARPEDVSLLRVESDSATLDAPRVQQLVLAAVSATEPRAAHGDPAA